MRPGKLRSVEPEASAFSKSIASSLPVSSPLPSSTVTTSPSFGHWSFTLATRWANSRCTTTAFRSALSKR